MYKSNCGEMPEEDLDTEYIPEYDGPENVHVKVENNVPTTKVYFEAETTGLGQLAEMTQLSALYNNEEHFNIYIMPSHSIEKSASEITGLCIKHIH